MTRRVPFFVVALCLVACCAAGAERTVSSYIPSNAFVVVHYDGSHPGFKDTTLHAFLAEPEVQAATEQVRPLVDLLVKAMGEGVHADVAPMVEAALGCEMALAVVGPSEQGGDPSPLIVARLGDAEAKARQAAERLLEQLVGGAAKDSVRRAKLGEAAATMFANEQGAQRGFAFDGPFVIVTRGEAELKRALAAKGPAPAERAVLRVRYDHVAMLEAFGQEVDAEARRVLGALGLGTLRTVDVAWVPKGKRLVTRLEADIGEGGERVGLGRWLAEAPPYDPEMLKLVPSDAMLFWLGTLDVPWLWDEVWATVARVDPQMGEEGRTAVARMEQKLGFNIRDDVLAHLGTQTLVMLPQGATGILGAHGVAVQNVRNGDALEQGLARLVNRLDLVLMGLGGPVGAVRTELKPFQYRGHTCYYLWVMGTPALMLTGRSLCYTRTGDRFIFSEHPLYLKGYLDFVVDNGPSILENPEFRTLSTVVPKGATSVSYAAWPDTIVSLYNTLLPIAALVQGVPGLETPVDLANMPSSRIIRRYARGTVACSTFQAGRYRFEVQGDGVDLLSPHMGSSFTVAMLAGMILPATMRARGVAREVVARNNLREIGHGLARYRAEQGGGLYPKSLGELVDTGLVANRAVFVVRGDPDPPKLPNGVPCSYESVFDKYPDREFTEDMPVALPMVWERRAFAPGKRNVLFFDAHTEMVDEARLAALLEQVAEAVKKHTKKRKAQF